MKSTEFSFVPEYPGLEAGPSIRPRSRLYSLAPIGVGTSSTEGLLSYIIRLAGAHSVSPRRLIMDEFTKICPEIARYRRHGLFFETNARSINGLHRYSELFVDIIETLCGLSAARDLTLLSLKALLPFNGAGLITPSPQWCSTCYAEMLESRKEIYQPLAWSFELYRVCSRHEKALVDRCPSCGKLQYQIPRSPVIGYCSHCGVWLGKRSGTPPVVNPFELWIATAIEEIIIDIPQLGNHATRERFVSQLNEAINHFTDGSRRQFCLGIGLPESAFQSWLSGNQRPNLPQWLAISYGIDIGPVQFLEKNFVSASDRGTLRKPPGLLKLRAKRTQLTVTQHQEIQAELDAVADARNGSISVTMLAKKHHLTRSHLRHRWPDQCRQISANYRKSAKIWSNEQLAQKCSITMETVNTLLERGCYPSQRAMRDALDRVGISLADPAIWDAYKQQLKTRLSENKADP